MKVLIRRLVLGAGLALPPLLLLLLLEPREPALRVRTDDSAPLPLAPAAGTALRFAVAPVLSPGRSVAEYQDHAAEVFVDAHGWLHERPKPERRP